MYQKLLLGGLESNHFVTKFSHLILNTITLVRATINNRYEIFFKRKKDLSTQKAAQDDTEPKEDDL